MNFRSRIRHQKLSSDFVSTMAINIVVLMDLNCFPITSDPGLRKKYLKWAQEYILSLVSTTASEKGTDEVDFSKILWSYKFFNSSKDVDYHSKKFEPFTITTFEAFEASSLAEYERFISTCPDLEDSFEDNNASCLSQALKRITSDMRWDEMPQVVCKNRSSNCTNMIYTILRVPRNDDDLIKFSDKYDELCSSPNSKDLLSAMLPKAFLKEFHGKYNIKLSFIDTWVLHKEETIATEWDGVTYSRQIVKILEYLNNGTVLQLQVPQPAPPGLPSYFTLLKNSLRSASATPSIPTTPTTKLSEAQKVLQNKKQDVDSSRSKSKFSYMSQNQDIELLNSSFSSHPSLSKIKNREAPHQSHRTALRLYKENDRKSKSRQQQMNKFSKYDCKRTLKKPNGNGIDTSPDSSNSDELSMCKNQETSISKFLRGMSADKASRLSSHQSQRTSQKLKMKVLQSKHESSQYPLVTQGRHRRISPTYSSMDNDSIFSDSQHGINANSRTAHLLGLATDRERKKWAQAIKKEEEERNAVRDERRHVLGKFETLLAVMKTRLSIFMEKCNLQEVSDDHRLEDYLDDLSIFIVKFKEQSIADDSLCILSLAQTIVQFIVEKLQQHGIMGKDTRIYLEKIIYVPISDLRATVLKVKNDESELSRVFRCCQFQILLRMEASWLLPEEVNDMSDKLRDEVVDLLSLLARYLKDSVDDFMTNVIVQGYLETHSEMLIRLFRGLNMDPPRNLILSVTPSKSVMSRSSMRGSIKSPFGSSESLFLPPSQVQLQYKKDNNSKDGSFRKLHTDESFKTTKNSARYASHLAVNNPKKMVMVPVRNSRKIPAGIKSPKVLSSAGRSTRVRRNLFEADKGSGGKLSSQMCSLLSRSPSLSASGKSHGSLFSPRLRSLRSKRKLNLDDFDDADHKYGSNAGGSPDMFSSSVDSKILCPATPSYKPYNSAKKIRRGSSYKSSCENIVIGESPEMPKAGFTKSISQAVRSMSFYSTKSDKVKSRAWEKSGNKMLAAKIKRTVDSSSFMNSGLTLSDLEIFGGSISSPDCKSVMGSSGLHTPNGKKQPGKIKNYTGSPCCSKSLNQNDIRNVEIKQCNVNASIEALIMSKQPLALLKTTPKAVIETPKKISFNFDERLIKTPTHVSSPGTPRSILKTPSRYENGRDSAGKSNKMLDFNATPDKCSGIVSLAQGFEPLVFEPQKLNPSPNSSDFEYEVKSDQNQMPQMFPVSTRSDTDASDSPLGNKDEQSPPKTVGSDTEKIVQLVVSQHISTTQVELQSLPTLQPQVLPTPELDGKFAPQSFLDLLNNGPREIVPVPFNQHQLINPVQPQIYFIQNPHGQSPVCQQASQYIEPSFYLSQSPISQFAELQQCGSQIFKPS